MSARNLGSVLRVGLAWLATLSCSMLLTPCLRAQVSSVGVPPLAAIADGPEQIDLQSGNLHFEFPFAGRKGRGLSWTDGLTFDNNVWLIRDWGDGPEWIPSDLNFGGWMPRPGWHTLSGFGAYVNANVDYVACPSNGADGFTVISGATSTDNHGTLHSFPALSIDTDSDGCPGYGNNSGTAVSNDGSGETLTLSYNSETDLVSFSLTGTNGTTLSGDDSDYGIPDWMIPHTMTDSNGNQVQQTGWLLIGSPITLTDTLDAAGDTAAETAAFSWVDDGTYTHALVTYTSPGPDGSSLQTVVQMTNQPLVTNFGCSGIIEYGGGAEVNAWVVTEIDFSDGSKASFTWEPTPGVSGATTGRLASVTLPSGGVLSYAYTGGSNGITCADGDIATLTRQTPDTGSSLAWSYQHTVVSSDEDQTTVLDPDGDETDLTFEDGLETQAQAYQGAATSDYLLRSADTCYNGAAYTGPASCNAAVTLPISEVSGYTEVPQYESTGIALTSEVDTSLNALGQPTDVKEYDYGTSGVGNLLRETVTTDTTPSGAAWSKPSSVVTRYCSSPPCTGTLPQVGETDYSYDGASVTSTSGTPQHVGVTAPRGNLTTLTEYTTGSATLSKTFTYFDTGAVQTATDVNGTTTTYALNADSGCPNSFPASTSTPVSVSVTLTTSMTWDCNGGVMTSSTDANSQTTDYAHAADGSSWRLTGVTDADGNTASVAYTAASGSSPATVEKTLNFGSSTADVLTTYDSQGRTAIVQRRQGPGSTTFDSVATGYGWNGYGFYQASTLPYAAAKSSGPGPDGVDVTNTFHDGIGRPAYSISGDDNEVDYVYEAADTEVANWGGAASGHQTDGLGRLISVCEYTTASGSGGCGQNDPYSSGFVTQYSYNALNQITGVTQNAQAGSGHLGRSFTYDELGRMTSETNPETGTTTYVFDSDSTCGTSFPGDLVKRVDAVGNVTCYAYDGIHRLTAVTYPSGSYASITPSKHFVYDAATVGGTSMLNGKGHMVEAYTGPSGGKITDLGFSYSVLGQNADVYELTPDSGSTPYHAHVDYWPNGVPEDISGNLGVPTLTYGVDAAGRTDAVTAASGVNPVTAVAYAVGGQVSSLTYGSSVSGNDSDTFTYYDSSQPEPWASNGRLVGYQYSVNGTSESGTLSWNATGTLATLAVSDGLNAGDSQSCAYSYDDLARVSEANCGDVRDDKFQYDVFGNQQKTDTGSFPDFAVTNNQIAQLGSNYPSYDANGNLTSDPINGGAAYTWDAENLLHTVNGETLVYDALGREVERQATGGDTEMVYGPGGGKLALMNGSSLTEAFLPLPGGATAVYNSSGLAYYRHPDWLGSSRLASTPARAVYSDTAYAPDGEPYATAGTADANFTGMNQDNAPGLYDFQYRELYSGIGRWLSPDPAGVAAVDPNNPQTWNRYAYVAGNMLSNVDWLGLDDCVQPTTTEPGFVRDTPPPCDPPGQQCSFDGGEAVPCNPGAGGSGSGGFVAGGSVACPSNTCSGWAETSGGSQYVQFDAFETGGSTIEGYYTPSSLANGVYPLNGVIYDEADYQEYIRDNDYPDILNQANALALQIVASASSPLTFSSVYNQLVAGIPGGQLVGGNYDFSTRYLNFDKSDLTCQQARCNGVHFKNGYIHLDTTNPYDGLWALLVHFAVDVLYGNLFTTFIGR